MAKHHHHQLIDGSFMPDGVNSGDAGQMAQGSSSMLRKSQLAANPSGSASGNNVQGLVHNPAIAESYEVKILSNPIKELPRS